MDYPYDPELLYLPTWSDLGDISSNTRGSWEQEAQLRAKYQEYYDGRIFTERIPDEAGNKEDMPLMYPVGINLVKMLCTAQADSMFGEWEEDILSFQPPQNEEVNDDFKAASELMGQILRDSSANTLLWELDLDRELFGGAALMIAPDATLPGKIRWSRIPLDSFYPIYDPNNPDRLLKVYIYTVMTTEQAQLLYNFSPKDAGPLGIVRMVEAWDLLTHTITIEKRVTLRERNPYGVLPFEFIPRLRSSAWWGDALSTDIVPVQDELNMRVADLGEAINYNTHPARWGKNLPKAFKVENFPLGPNVFWDLGRSIGGNSPEPQVGILEAQNPLPQGTQDYIKWIYDWSRTSAFAPPIAFGEDNGGGQRSGITLEIRMWPLIKATRRSRAYMSAGLLRAASTSAKILAQRQWNGGPTVAVLTLLDQKRLVPHFANLMPRDQATLVDEVVKRLSTTPPALSLETAVKKLGDGTAEVNRILAMLGNDKLYSRAQQTPFGQPGNPDGRANATRPAQQSL